MTCHERFVQFKSHLDVLNKWGDEQIWDMTCNECPKFAPTPWGSCDNIDESANSDFI